MPITLKPEPEAWLKARVESGDFASIEEAARELIDERIADLEFESDDLSWAKPLVDEGIAALERGERRVHLARRAQGPQRGSARRSARMTARVIVTDVADADTKQILEEIAREAGYRAADRFNTRVEDLQ